MFESRTVESREFSMEVFDLNKVTISKRISAGPASGKFITIFAKLGTKIAKEGTFFFFQEGFEVRNFTFSGESIVNRSTKEGTGQSVEEARKVLSLVRRIGEAQAPKSCRA